MSKPDAISFDARSDKKITESLNYLASEELPVSIKVTVAFGMYNEQKRLDRQSNQNPGGEDALRKKIDQLLAVSEKNRNIEWELIAADDGEPAVEGLESTAEVADRIFREYPRLLDSGRLRIESITNKKSRHQQ